MAATDSPTTQALGMSLMAAACLLPLSTRVQAESAPERATIAIKTLGYQDSQPGADRIKVDSRSVLLEVPVASEWSMVATATTDAISGASPAYHSASLRKMSDKRDAASFDVTRYGANTTLGVGLSYSGEADYLSRGLSVRATHSNESKNTTWSAAVAALRDEINPSNRVVKNESKQVNDWLLGVTQVVTTVDIAQLNVGYSQGTGYFTDPYKALDLRPRDRAHWTLAGRWNHHFEESGSTLRSSYRYYQDDWGVRSHTLGAEFVRPFGDGWAITPQLRYYTQTAADFYVELDPASAPFATNPPEGAAYFTEDHRLSAFGAVTVGAKLSKRLGDDWSLDIKAEWYQQRGDWKLGGGGSGGLAIFEARSLLLGVTRQF